MILRNVTVLFVLLRKKMSLEYFGYQKKEEIQRILLNKIYSVHI